MQYKGWHIPVLPTSALLFYLTALAGWKFGLLPGPSSVMHALESLYDRYGLVAMFVSAFLEGLVYIGLYFSGSFLIVLGVWLSDGTFTALLGISVVVAVALTVVSLVNYALGLLFKKEEETGSNRGLLLSMLHPNALAFYWFNEGLHCRSLWPVLYVPLGLVPYGFAHAYLLTLVEGTVRRSMDNPYIMVGILLIWLGISTWWWNYRSGKSSTASSSTSSTFSI